MEEIIIQHLSADSALAKVIAETVDKPDFKEGSADVYSDLLISIISQQLSG